MIKNRLFINRVVDFVLVVVLLTVLSVVYYGQSYSVKNIYVSIQIYVMCVLIKRLGIEVTNVFMARSVYKKKSKYTRKLFEKSSKKKLFNQYLSELANVVSRITKW